MEDKPESKPPFWSSLPGILTGLGGILVALTGLITALYSTGVIGSKANSNAVLPTNAAVSLASAPADSQSTVADHERYKALAGKWEVIEEPSQIYDINEVESVTWRYEATVSGNQLTLKGEIYAIDKIRNLDADDRLYRVNFVTSLKGLRGEGEYTQTNPDGGTYTNDASIRFEADLTEFEGKVEVEGQTYRLTGRKL